MPPATDPAINQWVGYLFYWPAVFGGIFGLLGGYLTDRLGRRRVLTWSILLYAFSAFAAGYSTSVYQLLFWRICTFVGVCVEFVAAVAWLAELFTDPKRRESMIGYTQAFGSFGGLMGTGAYHFAVNNAASFPAVAGGHEPWRYTLMSGVLPAIPLILIRPFLPESPAWQQKKAAGTLRRPSIAALFSPQLRWDTAVVSLAFLTNMYAVYAFFSWAPLVLTSLGFELVTAVRGALVFNLAGIVGVIAISWLLSRVGSRRPLAAAALLGAVALAWLTWFAADGLPALMTGIAVAGVAINAVQVGLYALAAHAFPTECRTSGVGFSLGAGRTGGIAAALGGGVLLTLSGASGFFAWIAAALLIASVAVLLVRRQIAARERYFAAGASTSGA